MQQIMEILNGHIIENETRLTLRQLCDSCSVHAEYVIELVNEGIIEPTGIEKSHWCFNGISINRVHKAKHLQRDLGINLAGIALALDLIEQIDSLHAKLHRY